MPPIPRKPKSGIFLGGVGGPIASRPKKGGPIVITSGPGRPAPIEKQPLPAYGPYKLPLTDVEKRIVIRKRTPKFVETSRGRIATGGGGVGFFTKGDKGKIMDRVRERAIDRQDTLLARAEKVRVAGEQRIATPDYSNLRKMISEKKKEDDDPGFLSGLADDLGLDDFYTDNVLPIVGRAFGEAFETAKETYGVGLVSPGVAIARAAAGAVGKEQEVDKAFDYAANLVKAGGGIAKTKGFEPAKPYVASAIDTATSLGDRGVKAIGELDDYLQSEAPVYDSVKTWADRSVVKPGKNAVVEALSVVTNQPINKRIDEASEEDKALLFSPNSIEQRGRETAATQEQRDLWVTMAMGEYDAAAWEGYESPFTREQLERMSDYELINVAYGTHTSSIASIFEAAKNDLKKIGAMPAAIGALNTQIQEANDKGDYNGLGNMAEFLARQVVANMVALNQAGLWVMTAGQAGQYDDLVRALKSEPILTSLDVASTATIYGKAATFGLKSGGALTKTGALASRVPGAALAGSRIARGAERVAGGTKRTPRPIRGIQDMTPKEKKAWYDADNAWLDEAEANFKRKADEIANSPEQKEANAAIAEWEKQGRDSGKPSAEWGPRPKDPYNDYFRNAETAGDKRIDVEGIRPRPTLQEFAFDEVNVNIPVVSPVFRTAAAAGRGLRKVADTTEVGVRDMSLEGARALGATPGPLRVFRPRNSIFSQSLSLLTKSLLEADNSLGRFLSSRSVKSQSAVMRALGSQRANVVADMTVSPVVRALDFILKKKPQLYDYIVYETSGVSKIDLPGFEDTLDLSPAKRADQLQEVMDGRAWERTVTTRNPDGTESTRTVVRYGEEPPEGEGWEKLELSNDERNNAETLAAQLRNVANTSQKDIDEAMELLDSPYREQIGNVSPSRRLAGVPAQPGSELTLRQILESTEMGNIERIDAVGTRVTPNVADLPGRAGQSVRERLKIGQAPGVSRRDKPGVARNQDETVVRISPIVAPEYRRVVEEILAEETALVADDVTRLTGLREALAAKRLEIRKEKARLDTLKTPAARKKSQAKIDAAKKELADLGDSKQASKDLAKSQKYQKELVDASSDVDRYVDSLMRDAIEMSDSPMGGSVFYPTVTARDAKEVAFAEQALAGRGSFRDIRNVHAGQFALLGDAEDINRFAGALARNLRVPVMAYEFVTSLTHYLSKTGAQITFSKNETDAFGVNKFNQEQQLLQDLGYLGNGTERGVGKDFVLLPVNDRTGFLTPDQFTRVNAETPNRQAGRGVDKIGLPEEEINKIMLEALDRNVETTTAGLAGRTVLIVNAKRWDALNKEIEAASKSAGKLRRLTRLWVRVTLSTLPRTPMANVLGSGLLGQLSGMGGYSTARKLVRSGNAPPEIQNLGIAGTFGPELGGLLPGKSGTWLRQYMDYVYSYNVKGEDMARLVSWSKAAERGLKNSDEVAQLRKDILDAQELDAAMQKLLEAVAKGKFDDGRALTPELEKIRTDALQKADDFLGGAQGLTKQQRWITTAIPFWMWYKHIFKLYFYTLPAKYPGRALTMNALARLGYEESARNGFFDSFYEGAIKLGEEEFGPNVYSKGLGTNIFPFDFSGALEFDEGAPGVQFVTGSASPVLTVPARLAGIGIPGAPIIGAEGERLKGGDVFAPGYAEAAVSEAERLVAPLGLLQSVISPRTSVAFNIGRAITDRPIPESQPRGEGTQYAVTPRGFAGLDATDASLESIARMFGLGFSRVPVRGPVAERRIGSERDRQYEDALARYRESIGLDY